MILLRQLQYTPRTNELQREPFLHQQLCSYQDIQFVSDPLVNCPFCAYYGLCSDQIVKSPPDLAKIGPLGSFRAIRIVGFVFIGDVGGRRGVIVGSSKGPKIGEVIWRASISGLKITQNTLQVSHLPIAFIRLIGIKKCWLEVDKCV